MDAFVRVLREGRGKSSPAAPIALVESTVEQPGGQALFCKVLGKYCEAAGAGRAQAGYLRVLASQACPSRYSDIAQRGGAKLEVVDCFTDPWGWNRDSLCSQLAGRDSRRSLAPAALVQDLPEVENALTLDRSGGDGQLAVFLDNLNILLAEHGTQEVAEMMFRISLRPSVSVVIAVSQPDTAATPEGAEAFRSLASCFALLREVPPLHAEAQAEAAAADGCLQVRIQRKTGRVAVVEQLYSLRPEGDIEFVPMPSPPTAQQVASAAIKKAESSIQDADTLAKSLEQQIQGGMRLTLSQQEREDKERVVLPYEHQGASRLHQGSDFTQYLPPAAGGVGAGSGKNKLGHILYIRDSDDEMEYDSDEDPDDDLDI